MLLYTWTTYVMTRIDTQEVSGKWRVLFVDDLYLHCSYMVQVFITIGWNISDLIRNIAGSYCVYAGLWYQQVDFVFIVLCIYKVGTVCHVYVYFMCEKTTGSLEANCFSQKYMYVYMHGNFRWIFNHILRVLKILWVTSLNFYTNLIFH